MVVRFHAFVNTHHHAQGVGIHSPHPGRLETRVYDPVRSLVSSSEEGGSGAEEEDRAPSPAAARSGKSSPSARSVHQLGRGHGPPFQAICVTVTFLYLLLRFQCNPGEMKSLSGRPSGDPGDLSLAAEC